MTVHEVDLTPMCRAVTRLIVARQDARRHNQSQNWTAMAQDSEVLRDAMAALEEAWDRLPPALRDRWIVEAGI